MVVGLNMTIDNNTNFRGKQWLENIHLSIKSSTIWTNYLTSVRSVALCTIRRISTTFVPMFGNSTVKNNRANDIAIIGKIS